MCEHCESKKLAEISSPSVSGDGEKWRGTVTVPNGLRRGRRYYAEVSVEPPSGRRQPGDALCVMVWDEEADEAVFSGTAAIRYCPWCGREL